MMTKLEKPEHMTQDEADERFYPNSYVMINCIWEDTLITEGDVVAYAPLKNGGVLSEFKHELAQSRKYGSVLLTHTVDPLDGGSLLLELCEAN